MKNTCLKPPAGWICSRELDHEGPCTATPSKDGRNGDFLDSHWCCKVCDGEIPYGHTNNCDIWKLEMKIKNASFNLEKFGAHNPDCGWPKGYMCDCGYWAAMEELK